MNEQPPPSYEKVFGDKIQSPKYEENSREEYIRIEIQNQNQTLESESVRRNQTLYGTIPVPSQNLLESILENQQRQLQRQEKEDQEKMTQAASGCCGVSLAIIFLIILALYAHFHG